MSVCTFDHVDRVVLIGGGDLMLHSARVFHDKGVAVTAVMAPRHAAERLPISGIETAVAFRDDGFRVIEIEEISAWAEKVDETNTGPTAMALAFGPAWIFPPEVVSCFGAGMINFNGIPVPHYLGGAHYTWQILNGDRSGGCVLQAMTSEVDRGPVLRRELFDLPDDVRTPGDYFRANHAEGSRFIDRAAADMRQGVSFEETPFDLFDDERLYFPRLITAENAWIDWSWSAEQIEAFCCAFDVPYAGAITRLGERTLHLSGVWLTDEPVSCHPFCKGLVVRQMETEICVAAPGRILRIERARFPNGDDAMGALKEGCRLHSAVQKLDHALTYRPKITAAGIAEA